MIKATHLETRLDRSYRTPRIALFTLKEVQTSVLLQDCVGGSAAPVENEYGSTGAAVACSLTWHQGHPTTSQTPHQLVEAQSHFKIDQVIKILAAKTLNAERIRCSGLRKQATDDILESDVQHGKATLAWYESNGL
ncbi:hypothetical protein E2C01_023412 [Portunus trituberculatus]|uniref:Uncharacterized protein n=1 Tax=Portunus trituberculatus TaxID=210409 RepID=A0A5B7EBI5_PORTR|nr:hypothetical protein [Portunus trituberculatus]